MTDSAKRGTQRDLPHSTFPKAAGVRRIGEPPDSTRPCPIGDLAREFKISTRTIRFYESRGLLRPARRGTTRIFGPDDRQRLLLIVRAKNLGLTLEEIAEHLAIHDADATAPGEIARLQERADRHIATLIGKRNDLQSTLKELREIRARLSSDRPHGNDSGRLDLPK